MRRGFGLALALLAACAAQVKAQGWAQVAESGRRSGYQDMGPSLQAMQDDDIANPGMLWVQEGEALWARKQGAADKSCADCHGAGAGMAGVATRFPAFSGSSERPIDLEQRINMCRTEQQKAEPLAHESRALLALSTYVATQSRSLPIAPPDDPRLRPFLQAGADLFARRQGQLNLSCANCHDDHPGQKLAASTIPQAHPTGYPLYRLEWQSVGSLQRRLRNCLIGMRAEPYAYGATQYVDLELYLMRRAAGMAYEAPGVRP